MIKPAPALFVLSLLLLSFAECQAQSSNATMPILPLEREALFPSKATIEQGRTIAESACSGCHGMDGISADPERPHIAGQRTVYFYRVLQAYQNGYRVDHSMGHASGFLNEQGLLSVAAYYANLPPARKASGRVEPAEVETSVQSEVADDPFSDIRPALKKCTKCHGETGNSGASGMPNLTAQDPEYFATSMQAYVDGGRKHKMMKKLVGNLDDQIITAMGVYYAVQEPESSETSSEGDEASGRRLAEQCANCHGDDGNASAGDMPSLAGQDARYFIKAMKAYLDGERKHEAMFKAVSGLSESDMQDLAAFYAARAPARRNVAAPFTAGEWIERCERCHGIDGNSIDPRFPMLAGQNSEYLRKSLDAYADKARNNSTMHAMADPLSDSDIERIALYFATREPKSVLYMLLPCEDGETN